MTVADSFKGARRLSARNDEVLSFDVGDDSAKSMEYCQNLAKTLSSASQLPKACEKYPSVVQGLEKKSADQKSQLNKAFTGMSPGQAQRAKANRLKGVETQAQFQRRMTRSHRMSGSHRA
ncbi:expressed unknown protein [Seminavis robusta]|uniref:Uncharacterized protein n=1 Tax=Seminavis robusta TaxID=568900 RepID=A0A9N8DTG2_9STRA|nr:expressed unknown protein [Seminavis robusta]|eukprot:Sro276_g106000.1 n/a (120) ;mRNA; f:40276-40866